MSEISTAAGEQSCGIEQVNLAVTQMDASTQQNAALVEQAAAAAHSLESQAATLRRAVEVFYWPRCKRFSGVGGCLPECCTFARLSPERHPLIKCEPREPRDAVRLPFGPRATPR